MRKEMTSRNGERRRLSIYRARTISRPSSNTGGIFGDNTCPVLDMETSYRKVCMHQEVHIL